MKSASLELYGAQKLQLLGNEEEEMDAAEVTNTDTHFIVWETFKGRGVLSLKKSRHKKDTVAVFEDLKVFGGSDPFILCNFSTGGWSL